MWLRPREREMYRKARKIRDPMEVGKETMWNKQGEEVKVPIGGMEKSGICTKHIIRRGEIIHL